MGVKGAGHGREADDGDGAAIVLGPGEDQDVRLARGGCHESTLQRLAPNVQAREVRKDAILTGMDKQAEAAVKQEADRFLEVWAGVEGHVVPLADWEHFALGYFLGAGWAAEAAAQMVETLSWSEPFVGRAEA